MSNQTPIKVKEILRNGGVPRQINFSERGKSIILTLCDRAIGCAAEKNLNMQMNGAAFEGWALILKANSDYDKVILDVDMKKLPVPVFEMGHYNRFLYRAMRFSEYYKWFELSDKVTAAVNEFKNSFFSGKLNLINNVGTGSAGKSGKLENSVEGLLGDFPELSKKYSRNNSSISYLKIPVISFSVKGLSEQK